MKEKGKFHFRDLPFVFFLLFKIIKKISHFIFYSYLCLSKHRGSQSPNINNV